MVPRLVRGGVDHFILAQFKDVEGGCIHNDLLADVAVPQVDGGKAGILKRFADIDDHLGFTQQGKHRCGGVLHRDLADHLLSIIAGSVCYIKGESIGTGAVRVEGIDELNLLREVSVHRVRGRGPGIGVFGTILDCDLALTLESDDRNRGVDNGNLARHLDSLVAGGVRCIVGQDVFTGLGYIDRVDHDHFHFCIKIVSHGGTGIRVVRGALMDNLCITEERDDWPGRVHHGHLAGDFQCLVPGSIGCIEGQGVFPGFVDVDRVGNDHGHLRVKAVRHGGPGINIGGLDLMAHFSFAVQGNDRNKGICHDDCTGDLHSCVALIIRHIEGDAVGSRDVLVHRVDDNRGELRIKIVGHIHPGIRVVRSGLMVDLGLPLERDNRKRGVDHRHLACHLNGNLAGSVRNIVGKGVVAELGDIHGTGDRGGKSRVDIVSNRGSRVCECNACLLGKFCVTNQGDDRHGRIDHRHLACHFNRIIAGGIRGIVGDRVFSNLGHVNRVDHDRRYIRIQVVGHGDPGIHILRTSFMDNLCLTL